MDLTCTAHFLAETGVTWGDFDMCAESLWVLYIITCNTIRHTKYNCQWSMTCWWWWKITELYSYEARGYLRSVCDIIHIT